MDGSGAQLIVEDSVFTNNTAAIGGAIYSRGVAGSVQISGSLFSFNNSTASAGALDNTSLVMTNSTVSQNTNGGMSINGNSWIQSSTFYDNNSGAANITVNAGTLTMKNSVLFSFSGGTNCSGTITSDGYNLDNNSTCTLGGTGDVSGVDPLLGQLLDNGGPTQTHALNYGSPAIDAGNPAGCTDDVGGPILTDQRGLPRAIDGNVDGTLRCDIGAYEAEPEMIYLPLIMR
jgi:predicted outer membrane repeat protein